MCPTIWILPIWFVLSWCHLPFQKEYKDYKIIEICAMMRLIQIALEIDLDNILPLHQSVLCLPLYEFCQFYWFCHELIYPFKKGNKNSKYTEMCAWILWIQIFTWHGSSTTFSHNINQFCVSHYMNTTNLIGFVMMSFTLSKRIQRF